MVSKCHDVTSRAAADRPYTNADPPSADSLARACKVSSDSLQLLVDGAGDAPSRVPWGLRAGSAVQARCSPALPAAGTQTPGGRGARLPAASHPLSRPGRRCSARLHHFPSQTVFNTTSYVTQSSISCARIMLNKQNVFLLYK